MLAQRTSNDNAKKVPKRLSCAAGNQLVQGPCPDDLPMRASVCLVLTTQPSADAVAAGQHKRNALAAAAAYRSCDMYAPILSDLDLRPPSPARR